MEIMLRNLTQILSLLQVKHIDPSMLKPMIK